MSGWSGSVVRADEVRVGDLVNVRGSASEVTSVELVNTSYRHAEPTVRLVFSPPFSGYYRPDELVEVVRAEAWKAGEE